MFLVTIVCHPILLSQFQVSRVSELLVILQTEAEVFLVFSLPTLRLFSQLLMNSDITIQHRIPGTSVVKVLQELELQTTHTNQVREEQLCHMPVLCDLNNTGARQDYFHVASLQQIIQYSRGSTGNTCPIYINNGNSEPIASVPIGDDLVIPIRTPIELTGTAFDSDGDELTYTWEQYNAGPEAPIGEVVDDGPAFISMNPSDSPTRVLPDLNQVLNSTYNDPHEIIPDYTRNYKFRFTVRDNNPGGGGTDWKQIEITSHAAAGPFYVSKPHFPVDWPIGDTVEVTWNVANTNITALVNCKEVDILLSLDGGKTFPITLDSNTPNDGSEMVIVPDTKTSQARVKIKGSGHIFFDISNFNFKIIEPPVPGFTLSIPEANATGCLPDPLVLDVAVASVLGYDSPVNFSIIDTLPSGVTATIDADEVIPGNATTITIEFDDTTSEGYHEFRVRATAENADTIIRLIRLTIVSNEFEQFALKHPFNGETTSPRRGNYNGDRMKKLNIMTLYLALIQL